MWSERWWFSTKINNHKQLTISLALDYSIGCFWMKRSSRYPRWTLLWFSAVYFLKLSKAAEWFSNTHLLTRSLHLLLLLCAVPKWLSLSLTLSLLSPSATTSHIVYPPLPFSSSRLLPSPSACPLCWYSKLFSRSLSIHVLLHLGRLTHVHPFPSKTNFYACPSLWNESKRHWCKHGCLRAATSTFADLFMGAGCPCFGV